MEIRFKTLVKGNYREVIRQFDRKLFEALAPPIAKMEILEFTGSEKGDRVHIKFLSPVKTEWISVITDAGVNDQEAWFTDEGEQLPFPLASWKHQHIVRKATEDSSWIIDVIEFSGKNALFTLFLYPGIYAGFAPRKKNYQQYFGKV